MKVNIVEAGSRQETPKRIKARCKVSGFASDKSIALFISISDLPHFQNQQSLITGVRTGFTSVLFQPLMKIKLILRKQFRVSDLYEVFKNDIWPQIAKF